MQTGNSPRAIFITSTDTGVGKTLLTALLLQHLHARRAPVLALKPFCCGARSDAKLLQRFQLPARSSIQRPAGGLTLDQINPFYFPEPLAPLVAARKHRRQVTPKEVVNRIRLLAAKWCRAVSEHSTFNPQPATVLIEGIGGLLVPLGTRFTVLDFIHRLKPALQFRSVRFRLSVLVVARNSLGTLNHCLLTISVLRGLPVQAIKLILMNPRVPDCSSGTNPAILAELLAPVPVVTIPFLGVNCTKPERLAKLAARIEPIMNQVLS